MQERIYMYLYTDINKNRYTQQQIQEIARVMFVEECKSKGNNNPPDEYININIIGNGTCIEIDCSTEVENTYGKKQLDFLSSELISLLKTEDEMKELELQWFEKHSII